MNLPLCAYNQKCKCVKELPYRIKYCESNEDRKNCPNYVSCHEYKVIWTQSGKDVRF